jgi:hypothetical protein
LKVTAFWVIAPCSLVEVLRCYRCAYCLYHQGYESIWSVCRLQLYWLHYHGDGFIALMEAVHISETSVYFETTRRYFSERCHLHTHRRDNLKSHILLASQYGLYSWI